jgi:uncharacterized protein
MTNVLQLQKKTLAGALLAVAVGLVYVKPVWLFFPVDRAFKFPFKFLVIIAVVLLFTWLQDKSLRGLNFKRLTAKSALVILGCWAVLELAMDFAVQPAVNHIFNEPADYSAFDFLKGDTGQYLSFLWKMWMSAAVGEELLFRGFAFLQLRKVLGGGKDWLIVGLSAALFALPHLYQGPAGLAVTFLFGLAFGVMYLRFKNIWINILVHGLIDTLFLTLAYFGILDFYA